MTKTMTVVDKRGNMYGESVAKGSYEVYLEVLVKRDNLLTRLHSDATL